MGATARRSEAKRGSPVVLTGHPGVGDAVEGEAQLSPDPMEAIRTGDWVRVDPKTGRVEVWPRSPER